MTGLRVFSLAVLLAMAGASASFAALSLEGQSGVFLNASAYVMEGNKFEVAGHWVDIDGDSVYSFSISKTFLDSLEVGYTHYTTTNSGTPQMHNVLAKWQFLRESKEIPAASLWAINRNLTKGGGSTVDIGLSISKKWQAGSVPIVTTLGVCNTKAWYLGLEGKGGDREYLFEGSICLGVTKQLWLGAEFKEMKNARTWTDFAARYYITEDLNLDVGIANLTDTLDNQWALGATYKF